MHDSVHDRVSMNITTEPLMPVLLRILSAEHGRDRIVASFEELEQHPTERFAGLVQKPLVKNKQTVRGVLAEEFLLPTGLVICRKPGLFEFRLANRPFGER